MGFEVATLRWALIVLYAWWAGLPIARGKSALQAELCPEWTAYLLVSANSRSSLSSAGSVWLSPILPICASVPLRLRSVWPAVPIVTADRLLYPRPLPLPQPYRPPFIALFLGFAPYHIPGRWPPPLRRTLA